MLSIKQFATCLGVTGPAISVRTLFGEIEPPLSLLDLVRALIPAVMQRKVDLNIICVGSELFSESDKTEIELALAHTSEIFAPVDLGIGKVTFYGIPLIEAIGYEYIDDTNEAQALRAEWSFPNKAIDVFIVRAYGGTKVGSSPISGSCKQGEDMKGGPVVAIEELLFTTAVTLAHEVGHYLGLDRFHHPDSSNLMYKYVPNGGELTSEQGETMKRHCIVYRGCRTQ